MFGKSFFLSPIILLLSYLRLHANSTDKIEIEQHCTLLLSKYKIQSEAQNQSGLDIHQVHPEQKKSTPSSRIGHHSWLGRRKKWSQNSRVQLPPVLRCGPDQGVATCSSTSRHHLSKVLHHWRQPWLRLESEFLASYIFKVSLKSLPNLRPIANCLIPGSSPKKWLMSKHCTFWT